MNGNSKEAHALMALESRKRILTLTWVLPILLLASCDNLTTAPPADSEPESAIESVDGGEFVLDPLAPSAQALRQLSIRTSGRAVGSRVRHYEFEVRLGPGEYDVVRIHRVVRERRPFRPVRTDAAVFMVPGSGQKFENIFFKFGIESPDARTSAPFYLAENGIDVWGIDLSFTQVPAELTDVAFMEDWGIERDVDHTLAAMSIARLIRGLTGQGFGRIHLLGFSYGASVAYAAAGRESQQHRFFRDIEGLIPADFGTKTANGARRAEACMDADALREALAAGRYRTSVSGLHLLAQLALTAPDDPSPLPPFAGLTNYQAGLFIGTNPGAFWQFVGVEFVGGLPVDLLYSNPMRWLRALPHAGRHPIRANLDVATIRCDEEDVPIDDHLADIRVPILYVGAGGGFGEDGHHTVGLTASRDVTLHTVSLQPAAQRAIDFGHADLWFARDASSLVWEPIREWLAEHGDRRGKRGRWW